MTRQKDRFPIRLLALTLASCTAVGLPSAPFACSATDACLAGYTCYGGVCTKGAGPPGTTSASISTGTTGATTTGGSAISTGGSLGATSSTSTTSMGSGSSTGGANSSSSFGTTTSSGTTSGGGSSSGQLGCSDGTREGFIDDTTFPSIAGCAGGWSVAGLEAASACALVSGNSSNNPDGIGCAAADLCAAGFHLCASADDVAAHLPAGQDCTAITPTPDLFFATQQSGPGCGSCSGADGQTCETFGCPGSPDTCTNDIYGCGTAGAAPVTGDAGGSCSPLNQGSNNDCSSLQPAGAWACGTSGENVTENLTVTKLGAAGGGVICCAD